MKTLIAILIAFATSGCAGHHRLLSVEKDAWVEYAPALGTNELYYCLANAEASGDAYPICFEPKYIGNQARVSPPSSKK